MIASIAMGTSINIMADTFMKQYDLRDHQHYHYFYHHLGDDAHDYADNGCDAGVG